MARQMRIVAADKADRNEEIEKAAAKYVELRDERMALTIKEKDAKEQLSGLMKAAKLNKYRCNDIDQEVFFEKETVTNVKVKKVEVEEEEEQEDGEAGAQ